MANVSDLRQLGKYPILGEIGRGGMAVVYKGWDPDLGRPVAVKVLLDSLAVDPDFVRRFRNEARMAAQLQHHNIVTIHDVGSQETPTGTKHYMVMEFLEGVTLDHIVDRHGPIPLSSAVQIVEQVAAALEEARRRDVVHRDVKPQNIMVGLNGQVKLMDFGLVRAGEGINVTRVGQIMGTPEYMAPEQARGEPVDHRTDIYSLGIVLYKMLSGQSPFARSDPYATLYAHVTEQLQFEGQLRGLNREVRRILQKATAKARGDRYQSAAAFAAELLRATAVQPGRPLTLGFDPTRLPAAAPPPAALPQSRPVSWPQNASRKPVRSAESHSPAPAPLPAAEPPPAPRRAPTPFPQPTPAEETVLIHGAQGQVAPPVNSAPVGRGLEPPAAPPKSVGVAAPLAAMPHVATPAPAPSEARSGGAGSRRVWAFVLISILLLALGGAGAWALGQRPAPTPVATAQPAVAPDPTASPAPTSTPIKIIETQIVVQTAVIVITNTPEPPKPTLVASTAVLTPEPTSTMPPTANAAETQAAARGTAAAAAAQTAAAATQAASTRVAAAATASRTPAAPAPKTGLLPAPVPLAPANDATVSGPTDFQWNWSGTLGPNQVFEVRIWKEGQGHWGATEAVRTNRATFDPRHAPNVIPGGPGQYFWSVIVLNTDVTSAAEASKESTPLRINIAADSAPPPSEPGGPVCPPGGC